MEWLTLLSSCLQKHVKMVTFKVKHHISKCLLVSQTQTEHTTTMRRRHLQMRASICKAHAWYGQCRSHHSNATVSRRSTSLDSLGSGSHTELL